MIITWIRHKVISIVKLLQLTNCGFYWLSCNLIMKYSRLVQVEVKKTWVKLEINCLDNMAYMFYSFSSFFSASRMCQCAWLRRPPLRCWSGPADPSASASAVAASPSSSSLNTPGPRCSTAQSSPSPTTTITCVSRGLENRMYLSGWFHFMSYVHIGS
jgi:hypothetical protein